VIIIYHNPKCINSTGTIEILKKRGEDFKIIEYLKTPPSKDELEEILEKLGMKPEEIIRKEEIDFEKYRGKKLTNEEWLEALVETPILIQRPIVINGGKAIISRPPEKVLKIL
jgi:arsenate reductase